MTNAQAGEFKKVNITELVPYWRNPRKNDKAVEKVKKSIETYGYQAPIIVDKEMVIIAGHTRYQALKQLGYEQVEVLVSEMAPKMAKEYRIIDNRTSEFAGWSDELTLELKEFSSPEVLDFFFPDIKLESDFGKMTQAFTQDKIDAVSTSLENQFNADVRAQGAEPMIEIPCPNCLEIMKVAVRDLLKERNWTE